MRLKTTGNSTILKKDSTSAATFLLLGLPAIVVVVLFAVLAIKFILCFDSTAIIAGIFLIVFAILGFYFVKMFVFAALPYTWEFYHKNDQILAERRIFGFHIQSLHFDQSHKIFTSPAYQHGEWGYSLGIISARSKKHYLLPPAFVSVKIKVAQCQAAQDAKVLADKLGIDSVTIGWEKWK